MADRATTLSGAFQKVTLGITSTMVINRKTNLLYRSMKDKQKKKNLEKALKNNE